MDRHTEQFERYVAHVFGPEARLAGSIGTVSRPGRLEIEVGGRRLGVGLTFSEALAAASRTAAHFSATTQTRG